MNDCKEHGNTMIYVRESAPRTQSLVRVENGWRVS